ncbi:MAG: TolC family protein, partial [Planctomycetales bacterium]
LDPNVEMVPADEQLIPIEMVDEKLTVDDLITMGLATRPELAEHQALVQARLVRLRQESLRPFIPYIQLGASAGTFGGGAGNNFQNQGGRSDIDALAVWELKNLGIGNHLLKRRRGTQLVQAEMEVEFLQDRVIAQVITAAADVASYRRQVIATRKGAEAAKKSYALNLDRIRDDVGIPLELVQAIRAQTDALNAYTKSVTDYNRSQYRLMHALGQPPFAMPNANLVSREDNIHNPRRPLGPRHYTARCVWNPRYAPGRLICYPGPQLSPHFGMKGI